MHSGPITQLLQARAAGDASAEGPLLELVYAELHQLVERRLEGSRQQGALKRIAPRQVGSAQRTRHQDQARCLMAPRLEPQRSVAPLNR